MDPEALLETSGTAWWTADTVDRKGNGLLLGWGFGHPEARFDRLDAPARSVGSLQVLVFSGGAPMLWVHQRFVDDQAWWRGSVFRFGDSQVEMLLEARARVVIARLDCTLPRGQKLTGTVEVAATPSKGAPALFGETALLTGPGKGRGALTVHGRPFTVLGSGAITRSVFTDVEERVDLVALMRQHTVQLAARRDASGAWRAEAASINDDAHISEVLEVELSDIDALLDGTVVDELETRTADEAMFMVRDLRRVHDRSGAAAWHGTAHAQLELPRPMIARVATATLPAARDHVLEADGRGSRTARAGAGAIVRERGLLERWLG